MAGRQKTSSILAFVCSWYPLAAADNAGVDRCEYSAEATIVPVDCAGTITAASILKAFARRTDGVLVAVCGRGDCHYSNGSESCGIVIDETHEIMKAAGIDPARLRLDFSSDVAGKRFASMVDGFAEDLAKLNGRGARRTAPKRKPPATKRRPVAKKKTIAKKKPTATKKAAAKKKPTATKKAAAKKKPSAKKKTVPKARGAGKKTSRRK